MFEKEIDNLKSLEFDNEADFNQFLQELTPKTAWLVQAASFMEVVAVEPGAYHISSLGGWDYSTPDQVDKLCRNGGIYLVIKRNPDIRIPINIATCPFTLDDRCGAKSKLLADLLGSRNFERYADFINTGFDFYAKQTLKVLVRGGSVLAMHTIKYFDFNQQLFFENANDFMKVFPSSCFVKAGYDVERTYARYRVCNSADPFMEKYAQAWAKAGLPQPLLKKSYPMLEFVTGDTGKQTLTIIPYLQIGRDKFPLGTELSLKHSSKATASAVKEKANAAFAAMQKGLISVEEMIKTELHNPYAVFVRAGLETGIPSKAKVAITAVLNNFKDYYRQGVDKVTAFDVYYEMCQIEHFAEFEELSSGTKMQVLEGLNRLVNLNWAKIDVAGREEF